MLDFGESLGGHFAEWQRFEHGYEHIWDWEEQGKALFALGFYVRPWERLAPTPWASVGVFGAEGFDPRRWRETYPFWPFFEMTPEDAYWAAKLVMRFDRPRLEAVVAAAQVPEAAAATYLVDALVERGRRIGRAYLDAVTALDHYRLQASRLCATDLVARYRLGAPGVVERLGDGGAVVARYATSDRGRVCLPLDPTGGYTVLRLRVVRGDGPRPPMEIHVLMGERPRILGVVRRT